MAITFNVPGALAQFAAAVRDVLTIEGDTVTAMPTVTAAEQIEFDAANLPMVVLEYGSVSPEQQGNGQYVTAMVTVHLVRALEAGTGAAADTIISRLSALAQRCVHDYRLEATAVSGGPILENAEVQNLDIGSGSAIQAAISAAEQQSSMAGGSVTVAVKWWEPWS